MSVNQVPGVTLIFPQLKLGNISAQIWNNILEGIDCLAKLSSSNFVLVSVPYAKIRVFTVMIDDAL
jgi:hypothetical protein